MVGGWHQFMRSYSYMQNKRRRRRTAAPWLFFLGRLQSKNRRGGQRGSTIDGMHMMQAWRSHLLWRESVGCETWVCRHLSVPTSVLQQRLQNMTNHLGNQRWHGVLVEPYLSDICILNSQEPIRVSTSRGLKLQQSLYPPLVPWMVSALHNTSN